MKCHEVICCHFNGWNRRWSRRMWSNLNYLLQYVCQVERSRSSHLVILNQSLQGKYQFEVIVFPWACRDSGLIPVTAWADRHSSICHVTNPRLNYSWSLRVSHFPKSLMSSHIYTVTIVTCFLSEQLLNNSVSSVTLIGLLQFSMIHTSSGPGWDKSELPMQHLYGPTKVTGRFRMTLLIWLSQKTWRNRFRVVKVAAIFQR